MLSFLLGSEISYFEIVRKYVYKNLEQNKATSDQSEFSCGLPPKLLFSLGEYYAYPTLAFGTLRITHSRD